MCEDIVVNAGRGKPQHIVCLCLPKIKSQLNSHCNDMVFRLLKFKSDFF